MPSRPGNLRYQGPRRGGAPERGCRAAHVGGPGACLAALLCLLGSGCGASSSDGAPEASCGSARECEAGERCEGGACVAASAEVEGALAASAGCGVLSCPGGVGSCCRGVSALASGSGAQAFAARGDLVGAIAFERGAVTATFSFTEPGQQGWVAFDLGRELELSGVSFSGRQAGVADRLLTLSANRREGGGCVFAFALQPRPAPEGSGVPFVLGSEVALLSNDFCFDRGVPGRASELVFGISASGRGEASLTVSQVTLRPD